MGVGQEGATPSSAAEAGHSPEATRPSGQSGASIPTEPARGATSLASQAEDVAASRDIEFHIAVDIIYHRSRQAFLLRLHRVAMFGTIIGGAVAVSDLVGAKIPALLSAACGALDLVFDWSSRAAVHGDLVRELTIVVAELHRRAFSAEACREATNKWIGLSAAEPATHHAARDLAYNQTIVALGRDQLKWVHVSWDRWLLANWLRFEGTRPKSPLIDKLDDGLGG